MRRRTKGTRETSLVMVSGVEGLCEREEEKVEVCSSGGRIVMWGDTTETLYMGGGERMTVRIWTLETQREDVTTVSGKTVFVTTNSEKMKGPRGN